MVWCVGIGYGNASLVAGSRAPQPTYEEGLYTASWRGVRGSEKREVSVRLRGSRRTTPSKRTRELEASVVKLKQRCAEKQRELQNEQFEHERLSSIIEALT